MSRDIHRTQYSSDEETYWSFSEGTGYSVWFHIRRDKGIFPNVISTQLAIPNLLFIFDKEEYKNKGTENG